MKAVPASKLSKLIGDWEKRAGNLRSEARRMGLGDSAYALTHEINNYFTRARQLSACAAQLAEAAGLPAPEPQEEDK